MNYILLVEDSRSVAALLRFAIEDETEHKVLIAKTFFEAQKIFKEKKIELVISDLGLPDSTKGEVVDFFIEKNIPTIVLTGDFSVTTRELLKKKDIIDYVVKASNSSVYHVVNLIKRVTKNNTISVLVADDSRSSRSYIKSLLKIHKLKVIEAIDGKDALEILKENPQIKMVITDENMPNISGRELVSEVRKNYRNDEISIIGISSNDNKELSIEFLKRGADDFLIRPFIDEELIYRVYKNLDMLDYVEKIKKVALTDFLTNLSNRKFFFEEGQKKIIQHKRESRTFAMALCDIDFFKRINDTYGHDIGDEAIKAVATTLKEIFKPEDIVARVGGEEFAVFVSDCSRDEAKKVFEKFREAVAKIVIDIQQINSVTFTISIGVTTGVHQSIDDGLKQADVLLYKSKTAGRDRVTLSESNA